MPLFSRHKARYRVDASPGEKQPSKDVNGNDDLLPPGKPPTMESKENDMGDGIPPVGKNSSEKKKYVPSKAVRNPDSWVDEIGVVGTQPIKFAPVEIQDKAPLSLFILQLIIVGLVFGYTANADVEMDVIDTKLSKWEAGKIYSASIALAAFFSGCWFLIMRKFAPKIIQITFGLVIFVIFVLSILSAAR